MTTRHVIASLTVTAAALAVCATLAVRAFPLEAQGRTPPPYDSPGGPIMLVAGGEHLLHGERPEYPARAIEHKVEGDVIVGMTLNERGEVSDARVMSGPEELRKATLESVLQWHYSPADLRSTETQATFRFRLPAAGETEAHGRKMEFVPLSDVPEERARLAEHRLDEIKRALADATTTERQREELRVMAEKAQLELAMVTDKVARHEEAMVFAGKVEFAEMPKFDGSAGLVEILTERISPATAKDLLAQAGLAVGDPVTEEAAKRLVQAAKAMDEHFRVEFGKTKKGLVATILTR